MSSDEETGVFVAARLDEEQARAEAMEHDTDWDDEYRSCPAARTEPFGDLEWGEEHCHCQLAARKAKRLREVEAGRAILETYTSTLALVEHPPVMAEGHPYAGKINAQDYLDARRELAALRPGAVALAAIWNDHPDYRDWKP